MSEQQRISLFIHVCCCHWFLLLSLLFLILCDFFVSATCKDEAVYRLEFLARFAFYAIICGFTLCVLNILIIRTRGLVFMK